MDAARGDAEPPAPSELAPVPEDEEEAEPPEVAAPEDGASRMNVLIFAAETAGGSRLLTEIAILLLAAFVGFQVISKVPNTLHTPLMSGTNAIHGIVLLGGLIAIAYADGFLSRALILVAIVFGTINVVGGFLVTDRMLSMFKRKPEPAKSDEDG